MRKKLFSILALLCLTVVSAWAVSDISLKEITADMVKETWKDNNTIPVTTTDFPGFTATTLEAAKALGVPNNTGYVYVIYGVDDNGYFMAFRYNNGEYDGETGMMAFGSIYTNIGFGDKYYYTGIAGTALKPDATRKVWTLAEMPAGNVELQVAYFPGMLVKPTSLVGGTMEIEDVTDTALPDGFEKDDAGNIYVEAGKKFTVKAVPATGYHLVGWSDDATIKDLEREFTMPADGSDFTVTATFSDEFELTFDDVNFKTNQNITVKVGDADKTDAVKTDGKLSVKAGQTVTLTAKQGYKFRSVEAKKVGAAPASVLSGALVDGATIKVNFKWRDGNSGDYVQGVYNAASGTFTVSKGGYDWGYSYNDDRAVYKVEKSGDNIIIGAGYNNYTSEAMVWTFNTTNDTYTTTNGSNIDEDYGLISVTLNGTDITSQLSELK